MWETEMPASRTYSTLANTSLPLHHSPARRTGQVLVRGVHARPRAMSAAVYRGGKLGRHAGLRLTRLVFIQRPIHRVNCARLSPLILARKQRCSRVRLHAADTPFLC